MLVLCTLAALKVILVIFPKRKQAVWPSLAGQSWWDACLLRYLIISSRADLLAELRGVDLLMHGSGVCVNVLSRGQQERTEDRGDEVGRDDAETRLELCESPDETGLNPDGRGPAWSATQPGSDPTLLRQAESV